MQTNFEIPRTLEFKLELLTTAESAAHTRALAKAHAHRQSESELLEAIIEVDGLKVYAKLGLTSMHAYCLEHLRLTEYPAYYFINVARKSRVVPELKEAIAQGELTVAKATKIVSVLTPKNQEEWIRKAKTLPKAELEKEVADVSPRKTTRSKLTHVGPDRNKLECELTDEATRDLKRAQDLEAQCKGAHQTLEQTLASALKFYLERKDPLKKAERAIKRKKATRKTNSSRDQRRALPAEVEHAIHLRDRGACRAQLPDGGICMSTRWIEIHHINEIAQGGRDTVENLITLCGAHHRQWHRLRTRRLEQVLPREL